MGVVIQGVFVHSSEIEGEVEIRIVSSGSGPAQAILLECLGRQDMTRSRHRVLVKRWDEEEEKLTEREYQGQDLLSTSPSWIQRCVVRMLRKLGEKLRWK